MASLQCPGYVKHNPAAPASQHLSGPLAARSSHTELAYTQGDAFPIGLALIPGGNATDLALRIAADSNVLGLCNRTFQDYLVRAFAACAFLAVAHSSKAPKQAQEQVWTE